jgi:hypothetical protein
VVADLAIEVACGEPPATALAEGFAGRVQAAPGADVSA